MKMNTLARSITSLIVATAGFSAAVSAKAGEPDFAKRSFLVRVLDEAGKPIQGAKIHCNSAHVTFTSNADLITNELGEVNTEVPVEMDLLRLWATKKSYVPLFANFDKSG